MTGTILDVVLILVLVLYAVIGYRQGILVGAFSLVGFLGGGAIGMWLLPSILANVDWLTAHEVLRLFVLVLLVFMCATVGQAIAVPIGSRLRSTVRGRKPGQVLDAVLGAVATVLAVAMLVWFVAAAVRGPAPTTLARAIGESRVLATIDKAMPPTAGQLFAGFRSLMDRNGIPKVFGGLSPEPIQPIAPPDSNAATAAVQAAAGSVVRVTGVAEACRRGQEGSGWVVAPGKVVTNAHVVAGMREASVQVQGVGREYAAQVVVFDPDRDLAVLAVSGLNAPALPLGDALATGAPAVVAGFPLDGPYRQDAARVRGTIRATGSDIYGQPGVSREIYSLYTRVEPGNSGGPLLSPNGEVVGVVFAKSLDDATTGYALTLAEARPVLDQAASASRAVSTGGCSTG